MKITIPSRVHFVGIGGIGMSALAQHLLLRGCIVSGSDRQENSQTHKLRKLGATVVVPHGTHCCNAQLVVRTSAVPQTNAEVAFAMRHGIPVVLREELLAAVFNSFPTRIAVCGTHGKTTVTAMLHRILERCQIPHAAFIGGEVDGQNYFDGTGVVVAEACEYNRSFLHLLPTLCVCTNIEHDHPDCYPTPADVEAAFAQLFEQSSEVLLWEKYSKLCPKAELFDDLQMRNTGDGLVVEHNGETVCNVRLSVCGKHNEQNALMALRVAYKLGLPMLQAAQALCGFVGVDRRWTPVADCVCNAICDYAHHPTEIRAALSTAKSVTKGRVVCVFQPHTYSRTAAFFNDFAGSFGDADEVVFLPVYSAREAPQGTTSFKLFKAAKAQGATAHYFATFLRAAAYLRRTVSPTDTLLLLGAGNVNELAQLLHSDTHK